MKKAKEKTETFKKTSKKQRKSIESFDITAFKFRRCIVITDFDLDTGKKAV